MVRYILQLCKSIMFCVFFFICEFLFFLSFFGSSYYQLIHKVNFMDFSVPIFVFLNLKVIKVWRICGRVYSTLWLMMCAIKWWCLEWYRHSRGWALPPNTLPTVVNKRYHQQTESRISERPSLTLASMISYSLVWFCRLSQLKVKGLPALPTSLGTMHTYNITIVKFSWTGKLGIIYCWRFFSNSIFCIFLSQYRMLKMHSWSRRETESSPGRSPSCRRQSAAGSTAASSVRCSRAALHCSATCVDSWKTGDTRG